VEKAKYAVPLRIRFRKRAAKSKGATAWLSRRRLQWSNVQAGREMGRSRSDISPCLPLPGQCPSAGNCVLCRPFVKWAGGKSQLLEELLGRIPRGFVTYYEPFLGGGALLFALQPKKAVALDINAELINAYCVIKEDVEALIRSLRRHVYKKEYYYKIREADRRAEYKDWTPLERASRLIYLNKTCYNGLYRVNAKGFFNVPFGRYVNPTIVDAANLRACHAVLQQVDIRQGSFEQIEDEVTGDDFIYFDPPYVPISSTAYFTGYSSQGFDLKMHERLAALCRRLDKRSVRFMLSNSAAPLAKDLYRKFRIETVTAARALNSKGTRRGKIEEVIVRNY